MRYARRVGLLASLLVGLAGLQAAEIAVSGLDLTKAVQGNWKAVANQSTVGGKPIAPGGFLVVRRVCGGGRCALAGAGRSHPGRAGRSLGPEAAVGPGRQLLYSPPG